MQAQVPCHSPHSHLLCDILPHGAGDGGAEVWVIGRDQPYQDLGKSVLLGRARRPAQSSGTRVAALDAVKSFGVCFHSVVLFLIQKPLFLLKLHEALCIICFSNLMS